MHALAFGGFSLNKARQEYAGDGSAQELPVGR